MGLVLLAAVAASCSAGSDQADQADLGAGGGAGVTEPAPTSTTDPGPPVLADTAEGLAQQLTQAELGIRDPSTPPALLARLGQTQQMAYGRLGARPELVEAVVAAVSPTVRPFVEANVSAVTELARQYEADAAAYPRPAGQLPNWTIVEPEPYDSLIAEYRSAETATGVPWQYLAAVHFVETRVGRIRGNSVAGAQGPMQFIPSTWAIYGQGGDINDTHDAIQAAARLLRATGAPGNMASALHSYNPSNRYVRAVTAYAELIVDDERAFRGFYEWQVYYGGKVLPLGPVS